MTSFPRKSAVAAAVLGSLLTASAGASSLTDKLVSDAVNSTEPEQGAAIGRVIAAVCPLSVVGADLQARCNEAAGSVDSVATGQALGQWSPEEMASQGTLNVDVGSAQLGNVMSRIVAVRSAAGGGASADSPFSRLAFFANGDVGFGDKDATALETGFDYDSRAITVGLDYRISDNAFVGAALGYNTADADLDAGAGNLETDGYSVSVFGSFYPSDQFYVDAALVYGENDFDQSRNINFNLGTQVNQVASSRPDGDYLSGSLGGGYSMNNGAWTYGPHARLAFTRSDIDAFTETMSNPAAAGGGLALSIGKQDFRSTTLALGGSVSYAMSTSWGVLLPTATAEYVHEFSNDGDSITGTFRDDPTATAFNLALDDGDKNYARVGVGASAQFAQGRSAFIFYQTLLGYEDLTSHSISAGLRLEF